MSPALPLDVTMAARLSIFITKSITYVHNRKYDSSKNVQQKYESPFTEIFLYLLISCHDFHPTIPEISSEEYSFPIYVILLFCVLLLLVLCMVQAMVQ